MVINTENLIESTKKQLTNALSKVVGYKILYKNQFYFHTLNNEKLKIMEFLKAEMNFSKPIK